MRIMLYDAGEVVNLRFVGRPDRSRLTVGGMTYTAENGLLDPRADGGLIAFVQLPRHAGDVPFEFRDGDDVKDSGILRVRGDARRAPEARATPDNVRVPPAPLPAAFRE